MNFIYCFSNDLKNKMLENGFKLLSQTNSFFIFENNPSIHFDFNEIDKKQFLLTNKMTF